MDKPRVGIFLPISVEEMEWQFSSRLAAFSFEGLLHHLTPVSTNYTIT